MNGYDEMRLSLQTNLLQCGKLTVDEVEIVMEAFCRASQNFDIVRRSTDLIVYDGVSAKVDEYLMCLKLEGRSEGTIYNYRHVLYGMFRYIKKEPKDITHQDVWGYLLNYQMQSDKPVCGRTMNAYLGYIKYFFSWLQDVGYITSNPTKSIAPIKYEKKMRESMTRHDLVLLQKACETPREKALISIMYATGCRVSEIARMKKTDISWATKTITVFGKGKKYRTVYFNDQAEVYLKDYLNGRKDESPYVFVSSRGSHGVNPAAMREWVDAVYERVSNELGTKVTPHIIRHTTATLALQSGMPVTSVQKVLGHEKLDTTMQYVDMTKVSVESEYTKYVV